MAILVVYAAAASKLCTHGFGRRMACRSQMQGWRDPFYYLQVVGLLICMLRDDIHRSDSSLGKICFPFNTADVNAPLLDLVVHTEH